MTRLLALSLVAGLLSLTANAEEAPPPRAKALPAEPKMPLSNLAGSRCSTRATTAAASAPNPQCGLVNPGLGILLGVHSGGPQLGNRSAIHPRKRYAG